jgi:hypothetical protein
MAASGFGIQEVADMAVAENSAGSFAAAAQDVPVFRSLGSTGY